MGGQYVTAAAKVGEVGWLPDELAVGVVRCREWVYNDCYADLYLSTGMFNPLRAIFVSGGALSGV